MHNATVRMAINRVREYMDQQGINQHELAKRANVSQATVSRALSGKIQRNGAARKRLFIFIGINESKVVDARERVMAAFEKIWDNTDTHADAIVQIIEAVGRLSTPSQGGEL